MSILSVKTKELKIQPTMFMKNMSISSVQEFKTQPTIFMKNVRDMRIVMQRVSFSPESGGVWNPKITCADKLL